ncbi:hypothetical protein SAMN02927924_01408 [Sphingobium faniae]|nr:hypothetical protein SAMN02927924_01408 [Sphingobium faniae]
MDDEVVTAVTAMALAGLTAGTNAMRVLVNRGLASPKDVDDFANSLTYHFSAPGESAAQDYFRDVLEIRYSPVLAELREYARKNWRGESG